MHPFERFDAWTHCHRFTLAVYAATRTWPTDERFGLISQIRRAAVSAEVNIAEGSAKRGPREFRRYLDISLGSLSETACLIRIAADLGYLTKPEADSLEALRNRA
ncbi:MAG: four helix bundle protein, partial [Gemmatimonadota bacterium]|nr:four helix bundle protein [Gemmatimonadota bacterium]